MTDRIKGFCVVLKNDVREDDFEAIRNAVLMLKGVESVSESYVSHVDEYIIRSRIRSEFCKKILEIVKD